MTDYEKFKKFFDELNIDYTEEGKYIVIDNFHVYNKNENELCIGFNDYDMENGKEKFQGFYIF